MRNATGSGRPITIRDVAETAGVSVGTVSRALNAPGSVRPATLEKVRAVIQELGFQPDPRAQNMRRRNTLTVGYVINDISNPLHAMIFKTAETELREHGYSLHLVNTGGRAQREAEAIEHLQRGRVDGLIMTINSERDAATKAQLQELRIPSVLLDRQVPIEIDSVLTDHATGMQQAVEYLIGLGHRRIGLITAGSEILPGRERVRGFLAAFKAKGMPVPEDLVRARSLSADFGFREATTMFQGRDRPTAVIAGGNQILVGVLRAIQQQDFSMPRDVSLIACDRTDLATTYPGPITLIDRDVGAIGRAASQLLLERMTGSVASDVTARRISFATTLILGRSCGPPAA